MNMRSLASIGLFLTIGCATVSAQPAGHNVIRLWENGAPEVQGRTAPETVSIAPGGDHVIIHVEQPSITLYLPPSGTRHRKPLSWSFPVAAIVKYGSIMKATTWPHSLARMGVAAFVLEYRLAREKGSTYTIEGTELGDLQRDQSGLFAAVPKSGVSIPVASVSSALSARRRACRTCQHPRRPW